MPVTFATPLHSELLDSIQIGVEGDKPMHKQLELALRQAIAEHFEHGQSFWTEMLLMERLGVSRFTVRQALAELAREGLIVRDAYKRTHVQKLGWCSVGVAHNYTGSDALNALARAVARESLARDLDVNFYHLEAGQTAADLLPRLKRGPQEERLVTLGHESSPGNCVSGFLKDHGYRAVAMDVSREIAGIASVRTDHRQAVRMAVEHLYALGHRHICFLVSEPADRAVVAEKIEEYRTIVSELGLPSLDVQCPRSGAIDSFDAAYAAMPSLANLKPSPTALFTASDPGAWAALRWAAEQGLKVPEQLSVLGFEGVLPGKFTHPPLSSVGHDFDGLAKAALDMLATGELPQVLVPPVLINRASTGPCVAS